MTRNPWPGEVVGNLRERIELVAYVQTGVNEFNEPEFDWDTVAVVSARAQPIKGDEAFAAGQVQAFETTMFAIRHRSDIGPEWRIRWRGRDFNIKSLRNLDERRRFLTIEATATA